MLVRLAFACAATIAAVPLAAQSPGLRLFSPTGSNQTQLVDTQGNIVHSWPGTNCLSVHVLDDGSLLRSAQTGTFPVGGATGLLQRLTFDGTLEWELLVDGPVHFMHHDIEPMPNGNVLVIAWQALPLAVALAAGRDPALSAGPGWFPDCILEIEPTGPTAGNVVWQWSIMDHVIQDFDASLPNYGIVENHPELLDLNYPPYLIADGDWNHANGLDYDPINDWIILSARTQGELYLIDHSTTTAEAAGHTGGLRGRGGDILYRWGNPAAYRAGTVLDQQLSGQHDPRFVRPGHPGAGHITVFNNYYQTTQSAVLEIELPLDPAGNIVLDPVTGQYGPTAPLWTFTEPGFYSQFVSSAERLQNGNTLICSGVPKKLFEVTPAGQTVWSYDWTGTGILFQSHLVERTLWANTATLPLAGGQVDFHHLVDSAHAGDFYLLLGSLSGTGPGMQLPGGVTLPLNYDVLTEAMVAQFNVGIFVDTFGTLDPLGAASSSLVLPGGLVPPVLAGLQLNFAHLTVGGSLQDLRASNAVPVTLGQ